MGVEVHEGEAGVAGGLRPEQRVGDRVIAAQRQDPRARVEDPRGPTLDGLERRRPRGDLEVAGVAEAWVRLEV